MPTQNVNLSEQQVKFISRNVDKGRYRSASEVVRAGLRLLEQQERQDKLKLEALRRLAKDAFAQIDRGEFELVGTDGLEAFVEKLGGKSRNPRSR